jgi:hypothetical protein
MVTRWQLVLAIVAGLLMLALIIALAFVPDSTHVYGISL